MGRWGHLYGKRWRKRARYQLQVEPLCRMCASEGRLTAASVADHVIPHRGDINSFGLVSCRVCALSITTARRRSSSSAAMTLRLVLMAGRSTQDILAIRDRGAV
jgi:5-methylcytosine-specific restriction protein A